VNVSRRGSALTRLSRRVSHLIAGWRTGLSRPVLILQAGQALNYFGYGLIAPFEIIYLHQIRGFSTSTAGLVLAATMATAAIATPPTGALLDRYSAKTIVVTGSLASAVGYARLSAEPGSARQGRPTEY
jgi:MFS family permease